MIQWLREKFETRVQSLVILTIAVVGIVAGVVGARLWGFLGFVAGASVGCFFALMYCIVVYGRIATLICIANSTEANTKLLDEIRLKLSDIETIKNKLNTLDDISSKLGSAKMNEGVNVPISENTTEKSNIRPSSNISERFDIVQIDGKVFAVKDSEAGKYFCPKCHARVVATDFACNNCNASLVAE